MSQNASRQSARRERYVINLLGGVNCCDLCRQKNNQSKSTRFTYYRFSEVDEYAIQ